MNIYTFKFIIFAFLPLFIGNCFGGESINFEKVADAIYLAEGSAKTPFPYGIKSIKYKGHPSQKNQWARRVCLNTINTNYKKWIAAGKKGDFISFMGNSYCPAAHDKKGHSVWAKNVNYFLNKNKIKTPKKVQEKSGPLLIIR